MLGISFQSGKCKAHAVTQLHGKTLLSYSHSLQYILFIQQQCRPPQRQHLHRKVFFCKLLAMQDFHFATPNSKRSGVTGYIGGEVLHRLTSTSDLRNTVITCLVRDASKADLLRQSYPHVQILLGDLDDDEKIRQLSAASDIVLSG